MGYPEVLVPAARNTTDAAYQHDVRATVEHERGTSAPPVTFTGDDIPSE